MADPQVQANDEQEIAESQNSLFDLMYDVVAQGANTRLGGFVLRRTDSVLSTVEKTAKWSLPQPVPDGGDEASTDGKKISAPPLIRPLPWLLFLPALVVMRMVRVGLSLLALMVGRPPVTPASVVNFVQKGRRKLRALKYRGQKLGRISQAEAKAEDELQTTWLSRIIMPLRTIVCRSGRVVVTPHRHHHRHPQGQQQQEQQQQPGRKRNAHERDVGDDDDSGPEVDEATVNELLDKYADDAGDSSFHADSASGESSDSSLSEQEKSAIEDVPSKPASEPARKESNGHAHKDGSQARQKSDLNVESTSKPAENGAVDGSKKQDAAKDPASTQKEPAAIEPEKAEVKEGKPKAAENGSNVGSKSQDVAKEERQKQEQNKPKQNSTASDSERSDSKQTSVAGQKTQQEEDAPKAQSMGDVKTNPQQKNKQQQQQNQPQLANANGGSGGKKQKRPSQGHQ